MTTDVLVAGAGPTGLTMAAELLRYGLSVRLIDRAPAPATTSRALVVQPRTLEIFDDLGIAAEALARGRRVDAFAAVFPGRAPARLPLHVDVSDRPELDTAYDSPLVLSQDRTEALLTEHLDGLGGRVERGVALESYTETADGVLAVLRHADGRTERAAARWIIGCDGAHSTVRACAGVPFEGATYPEEFIMADARLNWALPDGRLYVFPGKGVFAAWSMPGEHRFRIFCNVPPGQGDPTPERFQRLLDERVPLPVTLTGMNWASRYRLHRRGVPRYRAGRAFLAGDAAHIHSPVGAQGMNTGIQDAYNLAWKLALGGEERLDSYHAERHPVGAWLLRTTDRAFEIAISDSPFARLVRLRVLPWLLPALLARPGVRRLAFGLISQLRISYADSPLSRESGEWHGGPAPGARAWDGPLQGPGVRRLHHVLRGPHHTLLLFVRAAGASAADLIRFARRYEERYGPRLVARVVATDGTGDLTDPGGVLHRRYDAARRRAVYVIRPDGHVGYRGRDPREPDAELTRRLTPA